MKKGTVTGEVKSILKELGVKFDFAYSDNYPNNRVGAKLVGVYLTEDQKQIVKDKMKERGFECSFIRENSGGYYSTSGTRFCFYNKM